VVTWFSIECPISTFTVFGVALDCTSVVLALQTLTTAMLIFLGASAVSWYSYRVSVTAVIVNVLTYGCVSAGHVARMEETRNVYKILVGKSKGKT